MWIPINAIDGKTLKKVTIGAAFQCLLCGLRWIQLRSKPEPYIPADDYWSGNEFVGEFQN